EGGNFAHVDSAANDGSAFADSSQADGHELSGRREDDGRVERLGRDLVGAARPGASQPAREGLGGRIAWPGEGEDRLTFVDGELREQMGGGPEAVEAQPMHRPGFARLSPAAV